MPVFWMQLGFQCPLLFGQMKLLAKFYLLYKQWKPTNSDFQSWGLLWGTPQLPSAFPYTVCRATDSAPKKFPSILGHHLCLFLFHIWLFLVICLSGSPFTIFYIHSFSSKSHRKFYAFILILGKRWWKNINKQMRSALFCIIYFKQTWKILWPYLESEIKDRGNL